MSKFGTAVTELAGTGHDGTSAAHAEIKKPPTEAAYFSFGGVRAFASSPASSLKSCKRRASCCGVSANCFRRNKRFCWWTNISIATSHERKSPVMRGSARGRIHHTKQAPDLDGVN